ncbi:hypothetical protein CDAR_56021 [Caerostris darwini]|uniref:Uncharacterized protein n=1 Tax=Caerostris darwini TaxID=1538125 RepID=A0AAV4RTF7_9ARAC|nr:hypothetical protein CDAR_56021 [Caerostris darwini]
MCVWQDNDLENNVNSPNDTLRKNGETIKLPAINCLRRFSSSSAGVSNLLDFPKLGELFWVTTLKIADKLKKVSHITACLETKSKAVKESSFHPTGNKKKKGGKKRADPRDISTEKEVRLSLVV